MEHSLLYSVFDDFSNQIIDRAALEKTLTFFLNYSVRRLTCEIGSNSLRGLYKTLYSRVFNRVENKEHYFDAIVSFFGQLTTKDAWIDNSEFSSALKKNNLYSKHALCKYLLGLIENNSSKEKIVIEPLTIEHILPQNKNLDSEWQQMLGVNWESVRLELLHTLGNLTLTGYNSELSDNTFFEKKELLTNMSTKIAVLNKEIIDQDIVTWNADSIRSRANRLTDIILKIFPNIEPTCEVSFADPRYSEYTCEEPEQAKYKTPNYYILCGEKYTANSFNPMFRDIISLLYKRNPAIIDEMAKNNEKITAWSSIILFSHNSENVRGDYKIKGTDIFVHTGFSASYVMYFLRELLGRYNIPLSEFIYSARSYKQIDGEECDVNDYSEDLQ